MYFKALALASLAVAASAFDPDMAECGADDPAPKHIASMKEASIVESYASPLNAREAVTVPVYVHVVAKSESAEDGYISVSCISHPLITASGAVESIQYTDHCCVPPSASCLLL